MEILLICSLQRIQFVKMLFANKYDCGDARYTRISNTQSKIFLRLKKTNKQIHAVMTTNNTNNASPARPQTRPSHHHHHQHHADRPARNVEMLSPTLGYPDVYMSEPKKTSEWSFNATLAKDGYKEETYKKLKVLISNLIMFVDKSI